MCDASRVHVVVSRVGDFFFLFFFYSLVLFFSCVSLICNSFSLSSCDDYSVGQSVTANVRDRCVRVRACVCPRVCTGKRKSRHKKKKPLKRVCQERMKVGPAGKLFARQSVKFRR